MEDSSIEKFEKVAAKPVDPAMLAKLRHAETAQGESTDFSKLVNYKGKGTRGATDIKGEQKAVIEGERAGVQDLATKLTTLNSLKLEGGKKYDDEEYREYLADVHGDIRDVYKKNKDKMTANERENFIQQARTHGIELNPSEKVTESYEKAKREVGFGGVLRLLNKLSGSRLQTIRHLPSSRVPEDTAVRQE